MSIMVQNVSQHFWKLQAFACRIKISQILLCLTLSLKVANIFQLDALRRLIPAIRTVVYSMESVLLNDFYVDIFTKKFRTLSQSLRCSSHTDVSC
jgi:hypothetical protein